MAKRLARRFLAVSLIECDCPSGGFGVTGKSRLASIPQGEEYELEKAELEAQKERDKFKASLFEKAGHAHYPYLKDPFE